MNAKKVVTELKRKYPGKKILKNKENDPSEIICEVDPLTDHPESSLAVAVIDRISPHVHRKSQERYVVTRGKLTLFIDGKRHELKKGQEQVIKPGQTHWAKGKETWIKCYSQPGWAFEDHIIIEENKNKKLKGGR